MAIHRAAARGYELAGGDYERARPGYPREAVDLLVGQLRIGESATVVDLGAGTGKLTRLLQPAGARLVAVEPVAAMLRELRAVLPAVSAVAATAEAIPLADRCADAVVVGTAFHWFDGERALAEIHRVLRPGGGLGLVWNNPDRDADWVARVWAVVDECRGRVPGNRSLGWRAAFGRSALFSPLRHRRFAHRQSVGLGDLLARVASTSFIAALPAAERQRVLARVRSIAASHPDLQGRERFALPYQTNVYWCHSRVPVVWAPSSATR